jgi:hypothetical protein
LLGTFRYFTLNGFSPLTQKPVKGFKKTTKAGADPNFGEERNIKKTVTASVKKAFTNFMVCGFVKK